MRTMTAAAARRTALAAQGFAAPRPASPPSRRTILRTLERTQLLQLDSVSAVVRAHYAPVFSRIGAYDRALLDEAAWSHSARRPRRLVEYWAHEAALIPVEDWPLLRWRMERYRHGRWGGAQNVLRRNPNLPQDVLDVIGEFGASTAGEVERHLELDRPRSKDHWGWNYSDTKVICEVLFATGELSVAKRVGFQRHYDLTERVLPPEVLARTPDEAEAVLELVRRAATALGIATEPDLRDYYRLHRSQTEPAIAALVDAGELEPVSVAGWDRVAYLSAGARTPRRVEGGALLCPFDPLIFFRPRTERIFDFHYRIEIYTPEAKRVHGYYVFPFLLDGELVARVDLRAERGTGRLLVPGAFAEPGRDSPYVVAELARSLREIADWLELDTIEVGERGDLIVPLRGAFAAAA
ncbi:winged helix DNA-binding domain-containing protein [Nocardia sp. CDC159]|uniref:Winged helix DNA-binding domain-containing protein n=1 Tax=Nocardia pulmonis TaxID=2951408 RepID=A0A9X2EAF3_9NOCA|nr:MULTISPECIES: crosslink repair DNA glycosylase YcaQ family protein [Nocardia]MCM6776734.1 winged helix DNA-binding domain-containing protein [Nocardia pulmonis]MCM6789117.1 winged helix DNA-binding domain-containing protein [Nocardia sp. CDC159]